MVVGKIRNVFIKQHQRRRWRYLSLFICIYLLENPHDGASVLACASHLKVQSKNPKNFEYWFYQQLMSKIRNVLIKQHQRGRWRYLALFAHLDGARFLACV